MATHTYPRNLHTILQRLWDGKPLGRGWPRVDLLEKQVLNEILDVCYHASLMTEEGRPIVFRVAFISSSSPVSPPRQAPIPLEPIMRYTLGQPVPFTEGELRRLAPVADPRRVLIAVEQAGKGAQHRLQIYGLIDAGMSL
jgi:sensor domain DACNV-containing protein